MNPRLPCADSQGRGTAAFLRLWGSRTTVPIRGDALLFAKDGAGTDELQGLWRAAFGRALTSEPLLSKGIPTRAFIDEARGVGL